MASTDQVQIINASPSHQGTRYHKPKCLMIIGIITLVFGVISIVLGIVSAGTIRFGRNTMADAIPGIWSGVFLVIAGSLGIATTKYPHKLCLAGSHLGFMVVVIVCSFLTFIASILAIIFFADCNTSYYYSYYNYYYKSADGYYYHRNCYHDEGYGVYSLLLIFSLVQLVLGFIAAVYGCRATCCLYEVQNKDGVVNKPAKNKNQAQSQGQMVAYQQQPMVVYTAQPPQQMMAGQQMMTGQPMMMAPPMAGQPMTGQPMPVGQPMVAQPMTAGQPMVAQPMTAGQPMVGQPVMAQPGPQEKSGQL